VEHQGERKKGCQEQKLGTTRAIYGSDAGGGYVASWSGKEGRLTTALFLHYSMVEKGLSSWFGITKSQIYRVNAKAGG
jgi:hypothetical protein